MAISRGVQEVKNFRVEENDRYFLEDANGADRGRTGGRGAKERQTGGQGADGLTGGQHAK